MATFGRSRDRTWGDRAEDGAEPLADLWRRALSAGLHGSGCACGMGGFALTASDLEADILDFLAARYPRDRAPVLADVLAARRTASASTFPAWLDDVRATLDDEDRVRLEGDVRTVLASIGGAGGSFICA